jgi:hypothetical protein
LALQLFELVADPANLPLDLHCREGKDRCGTMSALLLLALGVSETDVVSDYVLSNALLHRRIVARMFAIRVVWILVGAWDSLLYDSEALATIMRVHASWLETAIGQVGSTHFTQTQPHTFSFLHPYLFYSTKSAWRRCVGALRPVQCAVTLCRVPCLCVMCDVSCAGEAEVWWPKCHVLGIAGCVDLSS